MLRLSSLGSMLEIIGRNKKYLYAARLVHVMNLLLLPPKGFVYLQLFKKENC